MSLLSGIVVLLILLLIITVSATGKKTQQPERVNPRAAIPLGELFLPDEPDFLPGVTLEREKREEWTLEDVKPFWQDPLKNGEEEWLEKIEMVIDNYLERIP